VSAPLVSVSPSCAFCRRALTRVFVDLGMSPLVSSYLQEGDLARMEPFYPLRAFVCDDCLLVQLPQAETPEKLFGDYPYLSSTSSSWLKHAEAFADHAVKTLGLGPSHRVVEIASNDGYLLKNFVRLGIPALGVEPASNIAEMARAKGIETKNAFFGTKTAQGLVADGWKADLIVGNNVLAHVPDLNDFVGGVQVLLKPGGTASFEFPHLLRTFLGNQFDQVFHEHFSYLSLHAVRRIFAAHGLTVVEATDLQTHGGSIRVWARHASESPKVSASVESVLAAEREAGLDRPEGHDGFADRAMRVKRDLLSLLIELRGSGKRIAGYGAPGKGSVLLNYCGIRSDLLDYTVDLSPTKQGRYLPGVHLLIAHPDRIRETRPDYVLILPWNLKDEIVQQLSFIREWGGKFIVPIPETRVIP
jgi:hypothetical protein